MKPVVIFGLRSDYARKIPYQQIPEGLTSLTAESCGTCHTEIYNEWRTSIHSYAYKDPFFQAYWTKDKHAWSVSIAIRRWRTSSRPSSRAFHASAWSGRSRSPMPTTMPN